jgi:selenocysteine-specific elongation factor
LEPAPAKAVLADFPKIRMEGELIALASHRPQISPEQMAALARIEDAFRRAGYQPPTPSEVLQSVGTDPVKGRALLETLMKNKRLIRVAEDLVFHAEVIRHIQVSLAAHKGKRFSVPEFKSWTQVSRKYAIPLLEYLDRQHVTRREGDARVVL